MDKKTINQKETKKDLILKDEKKYIYIDNQGVVHSTDFKYYIRED